MQVIHDARIQNLVVFLNKCGRLYENTWMAERTVRDHLDACGYDSENARIIKGSALKALGGDEKWEAELINFAEKLDAMVSAPPE